MAVEASAVTLTKIFSACFGLLLREGTGFESLRGLTNGEFAERDERGLLKKSLGFPWRVPEDRSRRAPGGEARRAA